MPPSLRKACHACSTAKRRCQPQLPQCPRCLEKSLTCTYDLEPVTHWSEAATKHETSRAVVAPATEKHVKPPHIFNSIESAHQHAISRFQPHGPNMHEVPLMGNPETLMLVMDHLLQIPVLTFRGQTSAFAHAQILANVKWTEGTPLVKSDMGSIDPATFSTLELEHRIQELLSLDIHRLEITNFLAMIHVLIAVIFALVFQAQSSGTNGTNSALLASVGGLLPIWENHFKTHLPTDLSSDLSPWQAWVVAESCRRTLLALQWISGVVELSQSGYCSYRSFVESLPFDARTGLWEAETEEAWNTALARHREAEVEAGSTTTTDTGETSLVSWCEFIESAGPSPRPRFDGMLQRLFLVAYYGKETQLPVDQQLQYHPKFRMPNSGSGSTTSTPT